MVFLPSINIAIKRWSGMFIFYVMLLVTTLGISPLALGLSFAKGGILFTLLQLLLVCSFEFYHFRLVIGKMNCKINGTTMKTKWTDKVIIHLFNLSKSKGQIVIRLVEIALILILIGIIESYIRGISIHLLIIIACLGCGLFYALMFDMLLLVFRTQLSWYYIKKYPTQYRIYYKIPDRIWYLSAKRAAKHPHVYPPVDDKKKDQKN